MCIKVKRAIYRTLQDKTFQNDAYKFFRESNMTKKQLIYLCANGSTFRSLGNLIIKTFIPNTLFRSWAQLYLNRNKSFFQSPISNSHDFNDIHDDAVRSLNVYWNKKEKISKGDVLKIAQSRKLVDLLFRHLPMLHDYRFDQKNRDWFLENSNCALDKYTLKYIVDIINNDVAIFNKSKNLPKKDWVKNMPKDPSVLSH